MPPATRRLKTSGTIGTLAETDLHNALKRHYAGAQGEVEVRVGRYWIDARRGDELIEIQTGGFSSMRPKLAWLLPDYKVRLVHPIALERQLIWLDADGVVERQRKSPKRGRAEDVFKQLVAFPELIDHPNLTLELAFTREVHTRAPVERLRRWDRGWTPVCRTLTALDSTRVFTDAADLALLLPALDQPFSNADLARAARLTQRLAAQMTYCLRRMGRLMQVGKRGRAILYEVSVIH